MTKHSLFERFSYYSYIFIILALPEALTAMRKFLREFISSGGKTSEHLDISEKAVSKKASMYCALALAGLLLITSAYHIFGLMAGTSGVHGVVPYSSVIPILNR